MNSPLNLLNITFLGALEFKVQPQDLSTVASCDNFIGVYY